MMAKPSNEVATGRFMNGAETLMRGAAPGCSIALRSAFALLAVGPALARPRPFAGRAAAAFVASARLPWTLGRRDGHAGPFRQTREAARHHLVALLEPGRDHGLQLVLLRNGDRLDADGVVCAQNIGERAVGPALHGARGDHDDLDERIDPHAYIDELAGPEPQLGVGKFGLELHRAGDLVHLIVE